jgi:hypothetical protein
VQSGSGLPHPSETECAMTEEAIISPEEIAYMVKDRVETAAGNDAEVWAINRIAELRRLGEKATCRVAWRLTKGRREFGLYVRRADHTLEPMPTPAAAPPSASAHPSPGAQTPIPDRGSPHRSG